MAYLGALGTGFGSVEPMLVWSRYIIAYAQLGDVIGQYAVHGGYVYVK